MPWNDNSNSQTIQERQTCTHFLLSAKYQNCLNNWRKHFHGKLLNLTIKSNISLELFSVCFLIRLSNAILLINTDYFSMYEFVSTSYKKSRFFLTIRDMHEHLNSGKFHVIFKETFEFGTSGTDIFSQCISWFHDTDSPPSFCFMLISDYSSLLVSFQYSKFSFFFVFKHPSYLCFFCCTMIISLHILLLIMFLYKSTTSIKVLCFIKYFCEY